MKKFTPTLCSPETKWASGYSGRPGMDLHKVADDVFGETVPGPWLTSYMIARFGWPNVGSDPYKNLCSWLLTTPVEGLYLDVTPYLGGGGNYHFGIRFTEAVEKKLHHDPGREMFCRRRDAAIRRWWDEHGGKLYAMGEGKAEGDEDELVHRYGEKDGIVGGLWKRPLKADREHEPLPNDSMVMWWMADFVVRRHPEADVPKEMNERERSVRGPTAFQRRATTGVKAVLTDLLREVRVRDIGFNVFGRTDDGKGAETAGGRTPAERFEGAGYSAAYWFSPKRAEDAARKERS